MAMNCASFVAPGIQTTFGELAWSDLCSGDPHQIVSTLCQLIYALGPDVSVVSINGGSTILVEILANIWAVGTVKS